MSGVLAGVLGMAMPLCRGSGADGVPAPALLDFATLARPRRRNSCLAAAAGMHLQPDIITRPRAVAPQRLYQALRQVAEAQPRTALHAAFDPELQAHYVARSKLCNFPDLIAVQVTPDATPLLYSRSIYGELDFGVNRQRLVSWLAALDAALGL